MGINDRDYSRPATGRGASRAFGKGSGISTWSVNRWLITICVAVFVLDQFLPLAIAPLRSVAADLPANAVLDPVDRGRLRIPTLEQLTDGKWPVLATTPKGLVPIKIGPNPRRGSYTVPVIEVTAEGPAPAMGTYTIRDEDGNTRKGQVRLQEEVLINGPIWVYGYFSTATALIQLDDFWGLRGFEFWRFISFQFLHADLMHLLFNMIGLYFFGSLVEQYLGGKRYLAFYLICGMAGAAAYLLLNFTGWTILQLTGKTFPVLLMNDPGTPLVGASAGVFGVVIASAFLVPNARVLLFFVIPMRLSTLAYGMVGIALFTVVFGRDNAGGEAAHIGGAVTGFWLIRRPHLLHGFFDFLGRYDPTSRSGAAYRAGKVRSEGGSKVADVEIDRILAKVHDKGLQSLTSKEKKVLREASRR
jgi:membrane associated rhomboid family serine protease